MSEPVHYSIWSSSTACTSQIDLRGVRHANRWSEVTCPACRAWSASLTSERDRIADEALTLDDDVFVALIDKISSKRCIYCGTRDLPCHCQNDE